MPNFQTSFYTGAIDGQPQVKMDGRQFNASLAAYQVSWTGDAAQNDTLQLFKTNKNFKPLYFVLDYTAFGSSVVIDIGDGTTADRFIDGHSIASAGRTILPVEDYTALVGEDITVTFLGANPDSGTLKVTLVGTVI